MFAAPAPTSADLRFTLFGVPVSVSPWFWLGSAFLGYTFLERGVRHLLMWVVCVFVSVLLHEFGHAFAVKAFGGRPAVYLVLLGGLCAFRRERMSAAKDVLISLAGPFAQFGLLAVVLAGWLAYAAANGGTYDPSADPSLAGTMLVALLFINVAWPVLNLLPIFPLDGGQVVRALLVKWRGRDGMLWTARVSLAAAAVCAALCLRYSTYMLILFALLAVQNFQLMRANRFRP